MWILACLNAPTGVLAQAQAEGRGFDHPLIQLSRFAPQPELAGANVAGDTLRGSANPRQLIIVNHTRAVDRDVVDEPTGSEVDDVPVYSRSQHVRTHHENTCRRVVFGFDDE